MDAPKLIEDYEVHAGRTPVGAPLQEASEDASPLQETSEVPLQEASEDA